MKAQRLLIFVSVLIMVLSVSCFSPWRGDEGNLTIVWGKPSAARFMNEEEFFHSAFKVILTGPGEKQEHFFRQGVPSATFAVTPGTWTVTIKGGPAPTNQAGVVQDELFDIRVMGISQVEVMPGKNAPKVIPMYTATIVYRWVDLDHLIKENNEHYYDELDVYNRSREELFIIGESFDFSEMEELFYGAGEFYGDTIYINRPIILIAEDNVTIGRPDYDDPSTFPPFFVVSDGGTLTLGLPGMAGTLTFDNRDFESDSLIIVDGGSEPGKLIMNSGVTLKNGFFPWQNGSVLVIRGYAEGPDVMPGGTFIMNGGTITSNHTRLFESDPNGGGNPLPEYAPGGGVFVVKGYDLLDDESGLVMTVPSGTFIRNGGVISGNIPYNVYYGDAAM